MLLDCELTEPEAEKMLAHARQCQHCRRLGYEESDLRQEIRRCLRSRGVCAPRQLRISIVQSLRQGRQPR